MEKNCPLHAQPIFSKSLKKMANPPCIIQYPLLKGKLNFQKLIAKATNDIFYAVCCISLCSMRSLKIATTKI